MRIKSTTISHFRGIANLELTFDTQTTVLAGVNGVGKSAVLHALSILLAQILFTFDRSIKAKKGQPEDIQFNFDECKLSFEFMNSGNQYGMTVKIGRKGQIVNGLPGLPLDGNSFDRLKVDSGPLIVHYDAARSAMDIPERTRLKKEATIFGGAYDMPLMGGVDFRQFFSWFKDREDLENESRLEHLSYRDEALSAVRLAVQRFTSFEQLRVRRKTPMRMTVDKAGIELSVNQLSDGERNMLAMVGDIARRLALLNPNSDTATILAGQGLVMIDEIELHLHPKWQRDIISNLEKTFPNCQFIVTTHSPQVLSHVHENQVWILRLDTKGDVEAIRPQATFGMDSNRILEEVMEVPERPKEAKDRIEHLFALLGSNDSARAKLELSELESQYPDLPELTQARALLRRKEIIGR